MSMVIFFLNISEHIGYKTIQPFITRKIEELCAGIRIAKKKYQERGFIISKWHTDPEFKSIEVQKEIVPEVLEPYAKNEHVGVIERAI